MTLYVNNSSKGPARIASLKIDKNVYTPYITVLCESYRELIWIESDTLLERIRLFRG